VFLPYTLHTLYIPVRLTSVHINPEDKLRKVMLEYIIWDKTIAKITCKWKLLFWIFAKFSMLRFIEYTILTWFDIKVPVFHVKVA